MILRKLLMLVFLAVAVCVMSAGVGAAAVITVDDSGGADFTSIQEAVNAASTGDTIEVRSGTYYENVDVNKQLTLRGVDTGAGMPVVDAGGSGSVIILSADKIKLEGFAVINSYYRLEKAGIKVISSYNTITNNNISNNNYGIYLYVTSKNIVISNNVSNNNYGINLYSSGNNTIINNNASNNSPYCIYLRYSNNNTITNNNASYYKFGINLEYSSNNTINANTASNNEYHGISLYQSSNNNTITGNNANNGYSGIFISNSGNNTITGNNASNNEYGGIGLWSPDSKNNVVTNNIASNNNKYGINLYKSSNNTIIGNNASNNFYYGIYLRYSCNNVIRCNNASNNFYYGIVFSSSSNNNTLYFNSLVSSNTGYTAYDTDTNTWDSGTQGNYYSDYTGSDSDGDGIGDTPYPIPGGSSVDRYPLMAPYSPIPPPPAASITVSSPDGGENWQAGTTQTIQWSYSGNPGSNVKIEFLKGGVVDSIITSSTPVGIAGSGSFNWEIPSTLTPGTDYQIKITSTSNTAYTDTGNLFSISAAPAICSTFGSSNQNILLSLEPINVGTGSYIYQHQDMSIPGRGLPLTITRSYNSMDIYSGPFGSGWTFNYNVNLVVGIEDAVVMREDGRRDIYSLNPDGTYSPPLNVYDTLDKNPDNTFTLTRKDQVKYHFSTQGKLNSIIDKNGNQISLTYSGDNLTIVTDASGRELLFTHDAAGRIISITDPVGRIWSYTYDDLGNLIQYSDSLVGQFIYTYNENHWMTSITDPRGNQIMANTYDEEGRVISQSNALNAIYTYSYDVENRETTETYPLSGTKIYAYDEHFWGLSETDALGNTISYAYDENGNRISVTNANGQTTQFAYDTNGDIIEITDPLSYTTSMTYDLKDNLISITDALGHQTFLEYDADSNLIKIVNALGDETVFTYDEYGQIISGTDANGNTAVFDYDIYGNQIAVTDALGNTVTFTYDIAGRLITTTDADGNTYTLSYDDLDRLVSVTDPLGNTASNTYDAVGNRISFIDAAGSLTSYSYNPLNQLVDVTDAMGGTVSYNYDIVGNMISMIDANGHTTNYNYDSLNRPVSIMDPLGYTTSTAYDAIGNRISFLDAEGSLTSYSYDSLNRLVEVTDAMGGSVHYTYDAVGNMMSMTDANGHTTNYAYDALNRPVSIIDPLGYATSNTYDAVGNVVSLTDANVNSTSYTYDAINRLAEIAYDDGQTVSYGYDATGNRLTMIDSHGTTNYQYDNLNRLISVINPDSQTVGYMYDAVGNRIQITYPDGKTITYGYDANNRLTGVTDWDGHFTGYSYDANSNLIGMTYPNSMSTEYLYDENNQLIELINENATQVISSFEYTLDAAGNRLSVDEWFSDRFESESGIPQVLTTSYEYDDLYRLTQVNYPFEETVSYNYDPMGNRISMITTVDGIDTTINYVYDASNRLLQSGGTTYDYDNNGNMIIKTENPGRITSYNYDGANRLISLSTIFDVSQREVFNFEYDGDGNRLSKSTINGKRTQSSKYLWDVNTILPQVLTESDEKGTTVYALGLDLISMTDPKRVEFYYHHDGLGSVRSLSDSKESIKTIYSYDAFGQMRKEMGHVDNDFRFTGEQMDDETGLIYLRARYYDPSTGRFINKDPFTGFISNTQSLNRYSYVRNNPVNLIDRTGLTALRFSPLCLTGSCTMFESPLDVGFTETGTFVSFNLGVKTDIKELVNIKKIVGNVGKFVSISTETPETGYSFDLNYGPIGADIQKLMGPNPPEISDVELSTNLDASLKGSATIVFRYPWNPPIDDIKLLGRATWRWFIPEAHSSEFVMDK